MAFMRADSGSGSINSADQSSWNFGAGGGGGSGGGGNTSSGGDKVWLKTGNYKDYLPVGTFVPGGGTVASAQHPRPKPNKSPAGATHRYVSLDDAKAEWYHMSDADRDNWRRYALSLGIISKDDANDFTKLYGVWQDAVTESARWAAAGKKVDPWRAAKLLATPVGSGIGNMARIGGGAGGTAGTQPSTTTSKNVVVNLTDPQTARAIVASAMQQYLGQDPTDEQVSSFTGTLNNYERNHPTVTTTTNHVDTEGNTTSTTTQKGGASADAENELLKNQVMSLPGFGAYQASTTMMNWLEAALGTPAGN
jgi:hypothetical protein